jgi:ferredoxin-fold anticodon binding domain-containing protein
MKAATGGRKLKEETMRVLSQTELSRLSRTELMALLRRISAELAYLPDGSIALRNAQTNLLNIRRALARPNPGPRP